MDLPIELLRSLVAVVEAGSLARAGERVLRTPSALSLQMSKLEDLVGMPLFERCGRRLVPTPAGLLLLGHARDILERHDTALRALKGAAEAGRVRLGLVQDFVEPLLPGLLARLRAVHPLAQIEVRVAGSKQLRQAMYRGELDVAVAARGDALDRPVRSEPMVWIGERRLAGLDDLPLVLAGPPCPFGDAAAAALDACGRRHHAALVTPSLSGVRAAIQAGLGLGCRTRLFAGADLRVLGPADGLPELPAIDYVLLRGRRLSPAADTACQLTESGVADLPAA
ncbi:MAG: LysR substrate-binding domain-containing protein [Actinomycetota bacterium]